MPANTSPIFGLTPAVSGSNITTTAVVTGSLGTGTTIGTNIFVAFTAGTNGSYIQKVRFMAAANSPLNSVATVLRVFYSTVNTGTPTTAQIFLLGEISVGALATSNATNATNFYELPLNFAIPPNTYILVGQHTAQTTFQNWQALVIGSNY